MPSEWQENTGECPEDKDALVEVELHGFPDYTYSRTKASGWAWQKGTADGLIKRWRYAQPAGMEELSGAAPPCAYEQLRGDGQGAEALQHGRISLDVMSDVTSDPVTWSEEAIRYNRDISGSRPFNIKPKKPNDATLAAHKGDLPITDLGTLKWNTIYNEATSGLDSPLSTQVGGQHYAECAIQPVQYVEANSLGYLEGCVLKRITRHNRAGGKGVQDIDKAIHELQLLRELRYGR